MGLRPIVHDTEAVGLSLLLFVLFPSLITMGIYSYEVTTGSPLISTEALPQVLGWQIDWVWQIVAVVSILIIILYGLTLLLRPQKSSR